MGNGVAALEAEQTTAVCVFDPALINLMFDGDVNAVDRQVGGPLATDNGPSIP